MKKFMTISAHILICAVSFLAYVFFHPNWYKFIFAFIAIITGMRFFAQFKDWGHRTIFAVLTVIVFFMLFFGLQFLGWIEYGQ